MICVLCVLWLANFPTNVAASIQMFLNKMRNILSPMKTSAVGRNIDSLLALVNLATDNYGSGKCISDNSTLDNVKTVKYVVVSNLSS